MTIKDIWMLLFIVAICFGAYRIITSVSSPAQTSATPAASMPTPSPTPVNDDIAYYDSTSTTFVFDESEVEKTKQEIATQFPEAFSQPEPANKQLRIKDTPNGFLNVRDKASLGGKIVAKVEPGETYGYTTEENGWYQIILEGHTSAWVLGTYTESLGTP